MAVASRKKGPGPYLDAFLVGTTVGSLAAAYLKFAVPSVWWLVGAVAAVIALFLTWVWVPFVRLVVVGALGVFAMAAATSYLFFGRLF